MDDEHELEMIRSDMEETRSSLADKLEALESQVVGKVETAAGAVADTVQAVSSTVQTVKDALDVRKQVERRPWLMMGGAAAVGFIGGWLLTPHRAAASPTTMPPLASDGHAPSRPVHKNGHGRKHAAKQDEGAVSQALQSLKGVAVGTVMDLLRDLAVKALPPTMAPDIAGVVDDLNAKLGGKPLRSLQVPETGPAPDAEEPSSSQELRSRELAGRAERGPAETRF